MLSLDRTPSFALVARAERATEPRQKGRSKTMKLRNIIREQIKDAIKNYNFEEYLKSVLDDTNIEALVEEKIESHLDRIDFEDIIAEAIDDIFEEEFDDYDIADIIKEKLEN